MRASPTQRTSARTRRGPSPSSPESRAILRPTPDLLSPWPVQMLPSHPAEAESEMRCRYLKISNLPLPTIDELHRFLQRFGTVEDVTLEGGGTALVAMSCTREAIAVKRHLLASSSDIAVAFDGGRLRSTEIRTLFAGETMAADSVDPVNGDASQRVTTSSKVADSRAARTRCRFHDRGHCRNGGACPFSHGVSESPVETTAMPAGLSLGRTARAVACGANLLQTASDGDSWPEPIFSSSSAASALPGTPNDDHFQHGYEQGYARGYEQGHADAARDIEMNAAAQVAELVRLLEREREQELVRALNQLRAKYQERLNERRQ